MLMQCVDGKYWDRGIWEGEDCYLTSGEAGPVVRVANCYRKSEVEGLLRSLGLRAVRVLDTWESESVFPPDWRCIVPCREALVSFRGLLPVPSNATAVGVERVVAGYSYHLETFELMDDEVNGILQYVWVQPHISKLLCGRYSTTVSDGLVKETKRWLRTRRKAVDPGKHVLCKPRVWP